MSGLQFVVDFVRALAWPVAIVALVVFLRRPIVDILVQLASGLRRLRAGRSDAEFDQIVSQTKAELTATVSGAAAEHAVIPALLRFAAAAEDDPASAIAQAFGSVEAGLRDLLTARGNVAPAGSGDPTAIARFARDQGLVPESIVRAVDGLVTLRNAAAADPPRVTREHAVQFLALIDALLFALTTQRAQVVTSPLPSRRDAKRHVKRDIKVVPAVAVPSPVVWPVPLTSPAGMSGGTAGGGRGGSDATARTWQTAGQG